MANDSNCPCGEKANRKSNLELYRILVMLFIVSHHYVVTSGVLEKMYEAPMSANSIFLFLLGAWGKTGINCFMMIAGYFMCKSRITLEKYLKLIFEVLFYNIVIASVFYLAGIGSIKAIVKSFLIIQSIDSNHYTACFLAFYLLIPFLNILLQHISKQQHQGLMCVLLFLQVFFGTVPGFYVVVDYILWFATVYIVAAYIRFYPPGKRKWGIWTGVFVLAGMGSILAKLALGKEGAVYEYVADCNTFIAFALAVCSFLYFKDLNIKDRTAINVIGGSTFGVLCIHTNSDAMRSWLWGSVLSVPERFGLGTVQLVLFSLAGVVLIFAVCTAIDVGRKTFLEKPFMNYVGKSAIFKQLKKRLETGMNG